MVMLKIKTESDRLSVAAILVKNGYRVSQARLKKDGSKTAEYFIVADDVGEDEKK
jgi:hypothetical protein